MKQWNVLLAFFHFNLLKTLTSGLPYQHLVILEPEEMLVPKEVVLAAQLKVSPRADGQGDYEFKEVPLISLKRGKEVILSEEKNEENQEGIENEKNELKETEPHKEEENEEKEIGESKEEEKITDSANDAVNEAAKETMKEVEEDTKSVGDIEENTQSNKVKTSDGMDSSNSIYITIPIYVNTASDLPLTLSIGNDQTPLKGNRQGMGSRRGALQKVVSPTSIYNKLL